MHRINTNKLIFSSIFLLIFLRKANENLELKIRILHQTGPKKKIITKTNGPDEKFISCLKVICKRYILIYNLEINVLHHIVQKEKK